MKENDKIEQIRLQYDWDNYSDEYKYQAWAGMSLAMESLRPYVELGEMMLRFFRNNDPTRPVPNVRCDGDDYLKLKELNSQIYKLEEQK